MPEETESVGGRKHRIIHWSPGGEREAAEAHVSWKRILIYSVGGMFALLLVAGVLVRAAKLMFGPELFSGPAAIGELAQTDPSLAFVSQSKAELSRETAAEALAEVRKLPQNHPVQLQKLILIEKAFIAGESLLSSSQFGKAYAHFSALNREIDAFGESVKAKQDAQQAYDTVLLKLKELELARSLAPEALESAFEGVGAGRQFLSEGSFAAAKQVFGEALEDVAEAERALTQFIQDNIWRGQEALTQGNRGVAVEAFRAALAKSPGNEVALQGLQRAEKIERVYALLQEARSLEGEGAYADAAAAYAEAFQLDGFSAAAQQGEARARRLETESRFSTAFNAAKSAFDYGEWQVAIGELEKALEVIPEHDEVTEMLKTARENAHLDAVNQALAKAYAYENQQQWNEARQAYYQTLELEPEQTDAKEGYVRTGRIIRLMLQYDKLIEVAENQANRAEFQAAISAFNQAMSVKPQFLDVSDRVHQLRNLLQSQSQPVEVTFKSDGRTWVTISNYRLLGKFSSTSVQMLPGDYEVVGRRNGYQDIVYLLRVRSGTSLPIVDVSCRLRAEG